MPPLPRFDQIRPGTFVSIVLKQDQRTGRQVQGAVAQTLTRGDHPRGVKVRLTDGRVGRVQQLVNKKADNVQSNASATSFPSTATIASRANMADNNPWAADDSQGNPYTNQQNQNAEQHQYRPQQRENLYSDDSSPWADVRSHHSDQPQQQQGYHHHHHHHQQQQQPHYQASASPSNQPPYLPQRNQGVSQPPVTQQRGISRTDTDSLLASQPDRAEQVEHMQHYESQVVETQDDRNQTQLQKEFPNIDSSLIAALYNDTKNMAEVREMLQELASS